MDSITSSSKEENESHAAVSQPPQLQSHGGFLQSNSQPIVFNDHLMMVSESSKLIGTPNSNSDYLNVLVNSPSAQPLGFTDRSLSMDARFCRNPARLLMMKSAAQGPVDQSLLTIESMGTGSQNGPTCDQISVAADGRSL
ncbi:hypothetical protein SAY87_023995 [Trapa incisa]|uniref:Uncharacterized protein n=1 Tax=Trapa incisa TaxID=236973 RepID=A0AAN7L1J3_9MYRT|nr:hypothetical protein SAY87_023995 [Trapa incisa]